VKHGVLISGLDCAFLDKASRSCINTQQTPRPPHGLPTPTSTVSGTRGPSITVSEGVPLTDTGARIAHDRITEDVRFFVGSYGLPYAFHVIGSTAIVKKCSLIIQVCPPFPPNFVPELIQAIGRGRND
jgi:hypothetical protein